MKLSIIIISYNTRKLLGQTLDSIPNKKDWEIVIVDNASNDDSVKMLEENYDFVRIIKNKKNFGFAKANNQGIKIAKGKFVLLLNSDTVIRKNAIETLLKSMEEDTQVGISSAQLKNQDDSIQPQGGNIPRLSNIAFWMLFLDDIPLLGKYLNPYQIRNEDFFKKKREIGWISGTAMMIKRQLFDNVGYLNESLFMYGEDVEFCMRTRKKGYKIKIYPESKITHFGHKSSGGDPSSAILGEYKALKFIFLKHKPRWEYPLLRLLLKAGALLRMLVFGILQDRQNSYVTYKKAFHLV